MVGGLRRCLGVLEDGKGWTLISDQQKGLLNSVVTHWPNAEHRNCARHIYANWHKKHKGDELKEVFWKACRSYCEPDFLKAIEEMKVLSTDAVEDFIKQNPKGFCRCYLDIETKSDVIVNNIAETFNGFIIKSRSKHIIYMLEDIRIALMSRLIKQQTQMAEKDVVVCPRIQGKLDKEKDKAERCEVLISCPNLFQVRALDDVVVDLTKKTCSCRKWDLTGIPCYHVCAIAGFLGHNVESYVHPFYTKEMFMKAYEFTIPPLTTEKLWPKVEAPLDPPPIKVAPGRPKKNRRKDPHEDPKKPGKLSRHGQQKKCSVCKKTGHNKAKCPDKGKVVENPEVTQPKRKRGRPKKIQTVPDQASQSTQQSTLSQAGL